MRAFGKILGRILLILIVLGGLFFMFEPRDPVPLSATFDPRKFGKGVQVYFESVESRFGDITPGVEKRVIWQDGFKEQRTPVSVLYIHGFSATSEEIRPVPDDIANALGANLVYTRLEGHGRPGDFMGSATAAGWMSDTAEALAAARAVGDKVVVISNSTGGTLAAAAALDPEMSEAVAAMIFVAPNFGVNQFGDFLLSWPGARTWLPWVIGPTRSFVPKTEAQGTYWTESYPSEAVVPMALLVNTVRAQDFTGVSIPALFWFSLDDQVVRPAETQKVAEAWGGPVEVVNVTMGPEDDPSSHVISGAIVSPGQTASTVQGMLSWLATVLP